MQINERDHYKHNWISHKLLSDFEVEDVWRFPVKLKEEHSIEDFLQTMTEAMSELETRGPAGFLFKLRFFLGKIFAWDADPKEKPLLQAGSIRERYAQNMKLDAEELLPPGDKDFTPVYLMENESLSEIENATVHAALHLGKVSLDNSYTVQMAVYVKPKGWFGRAYMQAIKPFRHAIVYPAFMKMMGRKWNRALST